MWEGERSELLVDAGWFTLSAGEQRSWLPKAAAHREVEILVLPLIHDRELMGVIALALGSEAVIGGELRSEARRLADRIALALGHVDLVQRLEALSAGTIVAFARAIDANSPWTAGHSERVTDVAMMLGARLGLSASELRTLKRGGLLHDIGKIAIPAAILDKAARLSDDEWVVMQRHPVVGVEILSPIPGFTDVLPLVRSHHERMDGLGYPDRLRGEAIPFLARVLAVADVFDALVSHRPYRSGMTLERTTDIIRQESGAHLDPQVVEVFLQGVRAGDIRHDFIALDSRTLADTVARTRRGILVAT
jgi:putative nucleotidyltransferase with HDIG domain